MSNNMSSCNNNKKFDYFFWLCTVIVTFFYISHWISINFINDTPKLFIFAHAVFEVINDVWIGVIIGAIMVGILSIIPNQFVLSILGNKSNYTSILRATVAGVLLDLCSHGILMIASQLYKKGASIGQVMAFLLASPWNSFSLTLILISLIGLPWTIAFIILSMVIAFFTGIIFDLLVKNNILPANENKMELADDFKFIEQSKIHLKKTKFDYNLFKKIIIEGIIGSKIVLRWLLFGIILTGLIRSFMTADDFQTFFGPTFAGLLLTIFAATIIEVCSEGSTPIAADILTRASAPGNSFAFLMAGVATDYTAVMVIKDTTKSWKLSLFLPLISLPQIILISYIIN